MRRMVGIFYSIIPVVMAVMIQIGVVILVMLGCSIVLARQPAAGGELDSVLLYDKILAFPKQADNLMIISILYAAIGILIFGIWYKKFTAKRSGSSLGEKAAGRKIVDLILLGISLQIFIGFVLMLMAGVKPEWFENYDRLMARTSGGNPVLTVVYVGFLGPVNEELIFR